MKIFIIIFLSLVAMDTMAASNSAELSIGLGRIDPNDQSLLNLSVAFKRSYELERKLFDGDILIGGGLRATNYSSDLYQTHSDNNETLQGINLTSFNLMVESQLRWEKFFIGFNIDFLGFSLKNQSKIQNTNTEVTNASFNLLRGGEKDKGTLNSQLFLGYNFDHFYTKIGLSHSAIEFEGSVTGTAVDRQNFVDTFFVGIGYRF